MLILQQCKKDGNFCVVATGKNIYSIYGLIKRQIPNKYWDSKIRQYVISPYYYFQFIKLINEFFPTELIISNIDLERKIADLLGKEYKLLCIQEEGLTPEEDNILILPETLSENAQLPSFQQSGVKFLLNVGKGIEGDVVGLGKTVISLTAAVKLIEDKSYSYCLIICPATLKRKWQNEINKFYPSLASQIIEGNKTERKKQWGMINKYFFSIVNYELLLRDKKEILNKVNNKSEKKILICDEVQYCKNHGAKRTRITKKIAKNFNRVFCLSASYMENSLLDLHSIMQITNPKILGLNKFNFINRYIELDYFGGIKAYKNVEEVREKVKPYIIRRNKEQVFEQLPDKVEIDYYVDLTNRQKKFYEDIYNHITEMIIDMEKARRIRMADVLAQINYLKQACLSTELLDATINESAKLKELYNVMESLDKESKVVIFCFYKKMVEIICKKINEKGYEAVYMHGSSGKVGDRQKTIDEFNSNNGKKVLVTSDALRTGVDLTSANVLINFDLLYNPRAMEQRAGRIDRMGQKNSKITIMNIIANNTIEETIKERLEDKEHLWQIITGGNEEDRTEKLTLNNIKNLLKI
ncbi:MAG: hypothetical protein GF317_04905 [Candidatus Lokiarchaeota archaeon]|nr:hypothetical protein [Candidatus Lokiarchaeota archaeon]